MKHKIHKEYNKDNGDFLIVCSDKKEANAIRDWVEEETLRADYVHNGKSFIIFGNLVLKQSWKKICRKINRMR